MSVSVKWDGLAELRKALLEMPKELAQEASGIVFEAAQSARDEIDAAYPTHTGNLRRGLKVSKVYAGEFAAGALLKNRARHATLYEVGTQLRHKASGVSTGEMWGKTSAPHTFVRAAIKWRQRMNRKLVEMVRRVGFTVRGDV